MAFRYKRLYRKVTRSIGRNVGLVTTETGQSSDIMNIRRTVPDHLMRRKEQAMSKMLSSVSKQAHAELASWQAEFSPLVEKALSAEAARTVISELPTEFSRLLERMPDPGPQMRAFSVGGAIYIALYLVLHRQGMSAAQVWPICDAATRQRFAKMSKLTKWLLSWTMFSAPWRFLTKRLAAQSKQSPVGGWEVDYLPAQPGQFDYGVTYRRCAIAQLAHDVGAQDFAPYICQSDIIGSEVFGWGLARSKTIAQGDSHCDFRFRKGAPTDVKVKLPVIS